MSIKHRVKDRAEDGKMRALWLGTSDNYGPELKREYHRSGYGYTDYSKSPSWYNRLYNNRPKSLKARALCRDIAAGRREADEVVFPHATKPNMYYW